MSRSCNKKVDKEDLLLANGRSPIKDIEIKHSLKEVLTDGIDCCEVYMKGIDHSYYYEGYTTFKTEELQYCPFYSTRNMIELLNIISVSLNKRY